MKETLESVDKLQADLDQANASKSTLKNRAKRAEDQVTMLQRQVQKLWSQAKESQAATSRVAKLEVELEETVARGGEIFVQGQDSVKRELAKRFPAKDFSWIDDIFSDEKDVEENENGQDKERTIEDNSPDPASIVIAIDESIAEAREEATDDVPPAL